jgi:lipopolysaccharide transport system ATP-binding protein
VNDIVISVRDLGKLYAVNEDRYTRSLSARLGGLLRRATGTVEPPLGIDEPSFIWALRHVSFEIRRGEIVGIIGRNGAGKSTLLKILARITAPTEGTATLKGRVGALLEVGTGFHPDLTGRENIFLNGALMGIGRKEINRRMEEIVEFSEVGRFLDTPVKHFSSGMFMRLAFSVAAHLDAEIMLVDEVLAVGDAAFQQKCLKKIREIVRDERTVLFISHSEVSIKELCTRALVFDGGLLTHEGPVEQCVDAYKQLWNPMHPIKASATGG